MRVKVNIDTLSRITDFVNICSQLDCDVYLIDGKRCCVSAKSLIGAVATMDWSDVLVECDQDIYTHIQDFIAE